MVPCVAYACGGTIQASSPVPQTGENILFVMEQDAIEAHI